jgi:hypothetical protein
MGERMRLKSMTAPEAFAEPVGHDPQPHCLVNLTPPPIVIHTGTGELVLGSIGSARIDETSEPAGSIQYEGCEIPLRRIHLGASSSLPPARPGTRLVVSRLVALAHPERSDLLCGGNYVRNDSGQIVAVRDLAIVASARRSPGPEPEGDWEQHPGIAPHPLRSPWKLLGFVLRSSWLSLLMGAVLVVLIALILPAFGRWEAAISMVALISVWAIQKRRQWLDSLPKRLTVHFWKGGDSEWVWSGGWEDAYLSGESDIRSAAQSLGTGLFGVTRLGFEGHYFVIDESPPPFRDDTGVFRRFEVHIPLSRSPGEPSGNDSRSLFKEEEDGFLRRNDTAIREFEDTVRKWRAR